MLLVAVVVVLVVTFDSSKTEGTEYSSGIEYGKGTLYFVGKLQTAGMLHLTGTLTGFFCGSLTGQPPAITGLPLEAQMEAQRQP